MMSVIEVSEVVGEFGVSSSLRDLFANSGLLLLGLRLTGIRFGHNGKLLAVDLGKCLGGLCFPVRVGCVPDLAARYNMGRRVSETQSNLLIASRRNRDGWNVIRPRW